MKNRNVILGAILSVVACFVLLPQMQAVPDVTPPPDGVYGGSTAEGFNALFSLTTGAFNTAIGWESLALVRTTSFNTGLGAGTLALNRGDSNTAVGAGALLFNSTAGSNTAVGSAALEQVTTGASNTAIGTAAGLNQNTGGGNVYIGAGVLGVAGESNHTYLRNVNTTIVAGPTSDQCRVDTVSGLLGHLVSSRRYKEDINPMDKASETLYRLKPVTFRYKKDVDPSQSLDYGLIAEDVAAVDSNLAVRDGKGQIESVRYEQINAMLLNEFLKEHKTVQEQGATIAHLQKQIEALTAGLQKVSAQLEVSKPAAQIVVNNQ